MDRTCREVPLLSQVRPRRVVAPRGASTTHPNRTSSFEWWVSPYTEERSPTLPSGKVSTLCDSVIVGYTERTHPDLPLPPFSPRSPGLCRLDSTRREEGKPKESWT